MVQTAHISEVVGKYSELAARLALLANGWTVHQSETDEAYDVLAQDPVSGDYARIQVKTVRQRADRGGDLVVYAKKGNGTTYDLADADYFIGVLPDGSAAPRVFMFENRLIGEYWCNEARASERWVELPLALDRTTLGGVA
ncbi:hypothetical protein BSK66_07790 [Paenibacillus odorifer]|uniref:PD(D/E)XK endonuclease domain-containing protein n=1 Tax=Paenibacillus odorifer TaxID=189426 RepID=A0A1R0X2P5_9BACL|nr:MULTISPECIES: hypothetical protein [Paenibacillus]ETT64904.1 hypothetical protein C171_07807 [Paenibacillus sp. FSL H8-237]OMD27461.1 hypothetical protein BJP51_25020 [Paenibacillus odorifer]OME61023.1 hypothetical protein BSK66_07790 [Paenibacillus odorifer]